MRWSSYRKLKGLLRLQKCRRESTPKIGLCSTTAKTVTATTSYAQITSIPNINITLQTFNRQQQTNVNNPSLVDILSVLTNITKSLDNVTFRLDILESNQSKSNKKNQNKKKRIAWNANGLVQRKQELEDLLYNENIDIALVSEIHFTPRTVLKIRNYSIYTTLHPSDKARGGTAIIIKESIKHFELEKQSLLYLQATNVSVDDGNNDLTVTAIYCPPQGGVAEIKFIDFFRELGNRLVVVGDYNAKHTHWGSRLIT